MDFDGSGIESETKSGKEFDLLSRDNEPIISFSPDRCRFDRISSRSSSLDISEFVLEAPQVPIGVDMTNSSEYTTQTLTQPKNSTSAGESPQKHSTSNNYSHQQPPNDLHRRLEKRIAKACINSSSNCKPNSESLDSTTTTYYRQSQEYDNKSLSRIASVMLNDTSSESSSSAINPIVTTNSKTTMPTMTISSGFDMRKVPALLPPQRLAIPYKLNPTSSSTTNNPKPHSQEKKPLVQWDSEESEEELSFFPAPKVRSTLTDNLSIDNMSLSGEEDDLHLAPPRSMSNRCPCDPRLLMDSSTSKTRRQKSCTIV